MIADEMVGWNHRLNEGEFAQTWGDSEGQVRLECCSPWSLKESDTTERLNNNNKEVAGCSLQASSTPSALTPLILTLPL